MLFRMLLDTLLARSGRIRSRKGRLAPSFPRRCRSFRPLLEILEARTLLSAPVSTTDGLVAAINTANSSGGATTITLASGATFNFTSANNSTNGANALPVITGNITIAGSGATIERTGSTAFRLFDVASGGSLTLQDLTLQGGLAQGAGSAAEGGAIRSLGQLTLSGVTVLHNKAQGSSGASGIGPGLAGAGGNGADAFGGGLFVAGGIVSLTNDSIGGNIVLGGAGGNSVNGYKGGNTGKDFSGGLGGSGGLVQGGGLFVAAGAVFLSNDIFADDHASGGNGGNGGNGYFAGTGGAGGSAAGGGLYVASEGSVTLNNDTFTNDSARGGNGGNGGVAGNGGIGGNGGNAGNGEAGGLHVDAAGNVTLSNDTIYFNHVAGGNGGIGGNGGNNRTGSFGTGGFGGAGGDAVGGGLSVLAGSITLVNDTLSSNGVVGGGGGFGGFGGKGANTTFGGYSGGNGGGGGDGGNAAGGGLYVLHGTLNLTNDTIAANSAQGGDGGRGLDGGFGGSGTFLNFSPGRGGNGGPGGAGGDAAGGGVYVTTSGVAASLANTLIAEDNVTAGQGKVGGFGGDGSPNGAAGANGSFGTASGPDLSGSVVSSDHDLIGDGTDSNLVNVINGDQVGFFGNIIDPKLGPLEYNGGPTDTMALLPGSPAIGTGDPNAPNLPATDQRGYSRFVVNALGVETVDIGAYEFGATPPPQTPALSISGSGASSTTPGGPITYTLIVTNNSSTAQSNVDVADPLPATATLVSWTAAPGWSSSAPPAGSSSGTVTASIASLPANSSATFTLVVQVTPGTTVGTVLNDTASFGPFAEASNSGANSASINTMVLYAPTLQVADGGGTYSGNPFPATATAVGIDGSTPVAGTFSFTYYAGTSASGTPLSAVPVNAGTYTVLASFTSNDPNYSDGTAQTTFTIAQAKTVLGNLTVTQITVGTNTTTVSGQLTSNTSAIPVGQSVAITINGVTQDATVATDGSFSSNFTTGGLGVGAYSITYSYAGDSNFTAVSGAGSLTVAYGIQLLFDNSKPVHSGAVLPIKLALTDANGTDISAPNIAVTATDLVDANGNEVPLNAAGNANPNDLFRYDPSLGGYIFNLSTKGLAAGTYTLYYTVGNDPTRHSLSFVVD